MHLPKSQDSSFISEKFSLVFQVVEYVGNMHSRNMRKEICVS
jgi:hypothetical protein